RRRSGSSPSAWAVDRPPTAPREGPPRGRGIAVPAYVDRSSGAFPRSSGQCVVPGTGASVAGSSPAASGPGAGAAAGSGAGASGCSAGAGSRSAPGGGGALAAGGAASGGYGTGETLVRPGPEGWGLVG